MGKGIEAVTDQKGRVKDLADAIESKKTEEKTLSEEREFFDRAMPGTSHEKPCGSNSEDSDK